MHGSGQPASPSCKKRLDQHQPSASATMQTEACNIPLKLEGPDLNSFTEAKASCKGSAVALRQSSSSAAINGTTTCTAHCHQASCKNRPAMMHEPACLDDEALPQGHSGDSSSCHTKRHRKHARKQCIGTRSAFMASKMPQAL